MRLNPLYPMSPRIESLVSPVSMRCCIHSVLSFLPLPPAERSVERLASDMFARSMFKCQRSALLAKAMPSSMFKTQRSIMAFEGDSFFTGGYVRSNIVGLSNHTRDYPNVTTYLATFLKQRASLAFASIGLGCNTAVHKDVHNQVGASNILLLVQLHHGTLWIEDSSGQSAQEVRPNTSRMGHVTQLSLDNIVSFNPKFYHQAHLSAGSIVLVGYTPRGLHNLSLQDRAAMPATSAEFWSLDESRRTLVRHHPVSRHALFVPSKEKCLPVPLTALSQVAAVQQTLDSGVQGTKLLAWRHPPAQPPAPLLAAPSLCSGRRCLGFFLASS